MSASRICIGGSVIETEPVAQRCRANKAASARRSILPVSFLGNAEVIQITLGTLKSAKRVRQNAFSRSASESPVSTTAAQTSSPYLASGTPKASADSYSPPEPLDVHKPAAYGVVLYIKRQGFALPRRHVPPGSDATRPWPAT